MRFKRHIVVAASERAQHLHYRPIAKVERDEEKGKQRSRALVDFRRRYSLTKIRRFFRLLHGQVVNLSGFLKVPNKSLSAEIDFFSTRICANSLIVRPKFF